MEALGGSYVPTLTELATSEGFSDDFPSIARLLHGGRGDDGGGGVGASRGLASAALGNAHPGLGLAAPTGLAVGFVQGAPLRGDSLPPENENNWGVSLDVDRGGCKALRAGAGRPEVEDDSAAGKSITQLCGRIRRADIQARLASKLGGFIGDGALQRELVAEESSSANERAALVRGLERDLRASGYSTTAHRINLGPDGVEEKVSWLVAADHGEPSPRRAVGPGEPGDELTPKELAAKIAAVSLTVSTELRQIARQRAEERKEDKHGERSRMINAMREDSLELTSRSAIDKEMLLRNMRLSRHAAMEAFFNRERVETADARNSRLLRAQSVLARVAVTTSSVDEPRLARCVEAAREAADTEQQRLARLSAEGRSNATEWAQASYSRDRGLWALKHEFEAALREVAECREKLQALFAHGKAAASPRVAANLSPRPKSPPRSSAQKREQRRAELRKRDSQAKSYVQAIEALPWAAMTIQTPHGPAWARWPCEQYPVNIVGSPEEQQTP